MDVTSYLLGKNASGGTPSGSGKIQPLSLELRNDKSNIINTNLIDSSRLTTMKNMFGACSNVEVLDLSSWNTSNVTNMQFAFIDCEKLKEIKIGSNFDTSNVTNMGSMCGYCYNLENFPYMSAPKVTSISGIFNNCNHLTYESIDNILRMCISMSAYTDTKTLIALSINTAVYLPEIIVTLPHYQEFINAGWTIS